MALVNPQKTRRAEILLEARKHLSERAADKAVKVLQPLLEGQGDPEALYLAGVACEFAMRLTQAALFAKRSIDRFEHPEALLLLARIERTRGNTDEVLRLCDRSDALSKPGAPFKRLAQLIRGGALEEAGRFDEARAALQPLVEQARAAGQPLPPHLAFEWSKVLVQFKEYDEAISLIDALSADETCPEELRRLALHLRAKACDRKKDYKGAWESATRASVIKKLPFDPALYEEQVTTLIANWSGENMAKFPRSACDSELPVFVAGMPRSGTSLIDQIIDAHPKAAGVGELATIEGFARRLTMAYDPTKEPPECFGEFKAAHKWTDAAMAYVRDIRKQAPDAQRIVNKALGNNKLVGLIARLFPKTRIIHAIRDPRDVAISCYMGGFNNNLHAWTTQPDWAATAWAQSMRMMEYWKKTLDVPILDVHYERLVNDPDTEFPRIIEFLGLEWDDACREFHKSRRTVRTLSYDQVNRPLYTSSAGRNANYAEFIKDVEFPPYQC